MDGTGIRKSSLSGRKVSRVWFLGRLSRVVLYCRCSIKYLRLIPTQQGEQKNIHRTKARQAAPRTGLARSSRSRRTRTRRRSSRVLRARVPFCHKKIRRGLFFIGKMTTQNEVVVRVWFHHPSNCKANRVAKYSKVCMYYPNYVILFHYNRMNTHTHCEIHT